MAPYLQLIAITIIILTRESTARELRPSYHGLEYQSPPPTGLKSPDLKSFFGETTSKSSSSNPSTVALPKAMNSNDTSWWRDQEQNNRRGNDHVRHVLLLGSLICGVTGVALLAASAFIYVVKIKSFSASTKNDNNNSLVTSHN